ncbi:DUF3365 domain-containing protein [Eggerthellaceae bacterium zg-1084]|uniref:ATP-binding protein n=1 Tax=Berryella wangjianweii TaxID=2734634 RepID=UPI001552DA38|nr:DUF3365 domain-containing protein [Berryella wangjianweii]NPD30923.1 DUF3365 domain-containing protein [Berryella wangjianweii]
MKTRAPHPHTDGSPHVARRPLPRRFNELVVAVVAIIMVIYLGWSVFEQNQAVEDKALAEARALNRNILAVWDYIDEAQDKINHNADGSYDFKGVYCATAAKSVAKRFTALSEGYAIRYARTNPRAAEDAPDAFEQRALSYLASPTQSEYYEMAEVNRAPVLRFASRLTIEESCLKCHGGPRGQIDQTGFFKEGMREGDLAGIASISIPVGDYRNEAWLRTLTTLGLFMLLLIIMLLVVQRGLRRWVTAPLADANEKLAQANRELEEASALREDFVATISHELRTPLSSIIAFTDLWADGKTTQATQRQLVEQVGQNSKALLRMVSNMIDTARVDAGKYTLNWEEIDLVDEVVELRAMAEPLAASKGVSFSASIDPAVPIVISDWGAIHTILSNLLANAISFTDAGGSVRLSLSADPGGARLVASVTDTGCGIAAEDRERIFERFERAGTERRARTVGSGLGLGLARSLARMLGGDITVESELGTGSTFMLTVPLRGKGSDENPDS